MTCHRPQISLLVPFRESAHAPERARIWYWLQRYWRSELPDAEIVIGQSYSQVFSKTEAVNDAAARATGRIFVILDSDAYLSGQTILYCAREIEEAARRGRNLWFVPYRHLYRLTRESSEHVLTSEPKCPYRFPSPPHVEDVESTVGSGHGHYFGAMCQIMPREAFETVGCMDPRFRGWGGEDVAFVRAVDTLWGKHKTVNADILHIWHPSLGVLYERMWDGQDQPIPNGKLAERYHRATGDRARMRKLVDEGCQECLCRQPWWVILWLMFLAWLTR